MSDITIYDDLLPDPDYLLNSMLSPQFNWHFGRGVVYDSMCDELDNYQFGNVMYQNMTPKSDEFGLVNGILNYSKLKIAALIRVKANLNTRTHKIIKHGFHVDLPYPCTTAIYYVNTCNGFTEFEDGTVVESVANRFVTFPSSLKHTGTTCTDQKTRIVINFNYFEGDMHKQFLKEIECQQRMMYT